MLEISEILRYRKNQDQLDPFRRLEVISTRQLHPAPCPQIFLPEDQHRDKRSYCYDVHPVHSLEQHLVVENAHQQHSQKPTQNPINLLNMHTCKLGMQCRTADLDHSQSADEQDKGHQQPVEVAE